MMASFCWPVMSQIVFNGFSLSLSLSSKIMFFNLAAIWRARRNFSTSIMFCIRGNLANRRVVYTEHGHFAESCVAMFWYPLFQYWRKSLKFIWSIKKHSLAYQALRTAVRIPIYRSRKAGLLYKPHIGRSISSRRQLEGWSARFWSALKVELTLGERHLEKLPFSMAGEEEVH